jgi:hypothetical protein
MLKAVFSFSEADVIVVTDEDKFKCIGQKGNGICKDSFVAYAVMCMIPFREIRKATFHREFHSKNFLTIGYVPYAEPARMSFLLSSRRWK